jgi:hypothetical protein
MWMIAPRLLCQSHLLGEHNEIHKHRHNFEKKHSIAGRVSPVVLVEPESMQARHDELADEMGRRGYNHQSPYTQPGLEHLPPAHRFVVVDRELSVQELAKRCSKCFQWEGAL